MERVLDSPHPPVHLPEGGLYHFIHGKLLEFGPSLAFVDLASGQQYTYSEVLSLVERASYHLQQLGVKEGDVFACCVPNSAIYAILLLALARLGAIFALINHLTIAEELEHYIQITEAKFLFVKESTARDIRPQLRADKLKAVFVEGSKPLNALFEPIPAEQVAPPVRKVPSRNVCGLLFSSGTTGLPKAVEMMQTSFLAQSLVPGMTEFGADKGQANILYQPQSHLFGTLIVFSTLAVGAYDVIVPKFDFKQYIQLVSKYKVKRMQLVPPVLVLLAKSPVVDEYDISCVQDIIAGAAPISRELEQEVAARLGAHVQVRQAYGLTETCCITTVVEPCAVGQRPPPGTVGMLVPGTKMKIMDSTGTMVGPNKEGEILHKSEYLMKGYRGDPGATGITLDEDGWIRTGDIGYYDEQGYIFVVDRKKELIKYNAFQVSPAELEGVLLKHPGVADAGVIGVPDKLAGELPHAWVVRKPDSSVTEEDIIKFVEGKVSPYKKLRGGVRFVTEVPKTTSGKILHRVMREEMKKLKPRL